MVAEVVQPLETLADCRAAPSHASSSLPPRRQESGSVRINVEDVDEDSLLPRESTASTATYSKLVPDGLISAKDVPAFIAASIENHNRDLGLQADAIQPHPLLHTGGASISFKDVSFSVKYIDAETKEKRTKLILAPCSGHFEPGTLVAIMGPSGCGKSTLLDILAGRKTTAYEGEVFLNGRARDRLYSRVTAYVPQEDLMHAHMTVKETVTFTFMLTRNILQGAAAAEMRKNWPRFVDAILEDLGLAKVANTKIGDHNVRGISGGQKRRVTLAKGLVAGSASVLFCDEPTSGLSSTDAEIAVKRMKFWTKKFGVSIFVVIHQPKQEVAALFDHLLLLTSEPGRIVYNGPMRNAFMHYAAVGYPVPTYVNPADFYLDLVSPSYAGQAIEQFVTYYDRENAPAVLAAVQAQIDAPGAMASEMMEAKIAKLATVFGPAATPADAKFAAPFYVQLGAVFARSVTLRKRDVASLKADVGSSVVKGVIVGIAFLDIGSKVALQQVPFIFMALQMSVMGGMQQMPRLINARNIMKLDVADRLYNEWAFIISEFLINNAVSQTANVIFLVIAFGMSGVGFDKFGPFYMWQLLTILTTDSLFSVLAAVAKTAEQAQMMATPLLIFMIIFNGFFVTLSSVQAWMRWAIYCSPLFYTIQQISIELFSDGVQPDSPDYPSSGQFVINNYEFRDDFTGVALAVLLGMLAIFRALQVVALKRLNNPEK